MALLGIDIGSTALKATLYALDGEKLAGASLEYGRTKSGEGFPPDSLWRALGDVIHRLRDVAPRAEIRAAAISSHGESFVPVDRDGRAIGPFILNTAPIAVDEAAAFAAHFGKAEIFQRTGLPIHSMYTLPKIAWLRANRPEVFAAADRFLCVEDYILNRLGVGAWISTSLASRTMALDVESCAWIEEYLAFAGIAPTQLATPVGSGTPVGRAAPAAADELGLPYDVQWVTGGHDQGCCSLGAGGVAEGIAVDGTGTFECVSIPVREAVLTAAALGCNFPTERHTVAPLKLTLSYIAGGVALKWFRDVASRHLLELATLKGVDPYELILADLPEEPTDLLMFPHLVGTGTPWLDARARGAVVGIDANTTYEDFAKSAIEGITLEMGWNLELQASIGIDIGRIHAVGGGARSERWLQMKADIFNREVVAVTGEASCAGAAMGAGVGIGVFGSYAEAAAAFVREGKAFTPRAQQVAAYREKAARYRDVAGRLYGFVAPTS
ncbi:L-fuculokinase [Pleomorphomonas sp. PLEO]|uniref:FGGY-family carbohydrate kinase n=1 Tax=Pleomorphomonas sp. PLEO TaxID=3239306 RepID=UPI00351DE818